ncbi:hypothetical protein WAF17_13005 [Bernardetia sp. ABR2-2B]|uniref:hypothetical protein n=1 Tax=Bernardetia sp. ABR2-2B TaxID=3127472 RepID=UPI0030CF14F6
MTNSVDTTIKLMNVGSTYKELEAICIGYEGNNKELFDYYNDMKKWLSTIYIFIQSEAEINYKLDKENLAKERIERRKEMENIKSEIEKANSAPAVVKNKWIEKTWFKQKYFVFKIFGYSFSTILEVAKK